MLLCVDYTISNQQLIYLNQNCSYKIYGCYYIPRYVQHHSYIAYVYSIIVEQQINNLVIYMYKIEV